MNLAELKSSGDLLGIHARPARKRVDTNPTVRAWRTAKRVTLMLLLAGSFMFYYVLDKMNQAYTGF